MARVEKKTATAANKKAQLVPGMTDILPDPNGSWDFILRKLLNLAAAFGFSRIDTPVLEEFSLYENFDIENVTIPAFTDPEGRKIAVRPEVLPGVMRAHGEHKVFDTLKLSKWYYNAPVSAYDEHQRKFINSWEYGFELLGEYGSLNQVQLISLVWKFLTGIGLVGISLEINSIGKRERRHDYEEALGNYLQNKKYELCNECVNAIDADPLQVFRCKNLECKTVATEAPQIVDYLDDDSRKSFTGVLEGLDELGISYSMNPMLVGKKGSSGIVFVFKYKDEVNEYFIGEGGSHDEIYQVVTGKPGFSFGFVGYSEVLRAAISNNPVPHVETFRAEVFLVPLGDLAAKKALRLFSELWDAKITVHDNFGNIGVKNQLKMAESLKAVIALIIGQKEAMEEMVILRDVKSGMQEVFQYERIIEEVKKRLGK